MRKFLIILSVIFLPFSASAGGATESVFIGHGNLIIEKAKEYQGQQHLYNKSFICKEWVRKVVKEASSDKIVIPPTCPNGSGWYWCPLPKNIYEISIDDVNPGDIIQMNYKLKNGRITPHTAIVLEKNSQDICFIDSNWVADYKVGVHCKLLDDFLSRLVNYTVYKIAQG